MSSATPPPASFDPAAVAAALIGTWRFETEAEPTGLGYLHHTADGRSIQFRLDPQRPGKRWPMRLWVSLESPSIMRYRPRPDQEGWTRAYSFDGVTLNIATPDGDRIFACRQVPPEEIPEWFSAALAAQLARP